jgi:DNA-binding beta-propeller fold protein YncE
MNLRRSLILAFAIIVGACGGGGGDSAPPAGGGGGGGGEPTPNGTGEIVFPWAHSAATSPTISIRGIASDPEGVASVSINGAPAAITATGSAATQALFAKTRLAEGEVEWSAEVDLEKGENELVISVEDMDGDITEDVATATITYLEVPLEFMLDRDSTRLVGLSYTLGSTGFVQKLVQHDYVTQEQKIFEGFPAWSAALGPCLRPFDNELLYLSLPLTDIWQLRRFDLTTQEDSLIVEIPTSAWGDPGPGFQNLPSVRQLVCGGVHTSAYVLVNYSDENGAGYGTSGFAKSHLVEIELATKDITILSASDPGESPRWLAEYIALAEESIITLRGFGQSVPLTSIALADGARTTFAPDIEVDGVTLDAALDYERVYVTTMEGVDEIDVSVPAKRNISPVDDTHPLVFSQPRSIGFDPANNRVIIGDSDLDALIAVNISTGERSEFLSRRVGAGVPLIVPRAFALSADATRAYVADDGSNAPARLFEVDLATGDRQLIGDISQSITHFITGFALDEDGGRVFVSAHDIIIEVDLESEAVQTIATTGSTILEAIGALELDIDNDRLLIGDPASDGIFALNLATHAVEVVSQESVQGDGPPFGSVVSLTRVAGTPELYVAGQTSETVMRVDLETGDREELMTGCDLGLSSSFQGLGQVLYNGVLNELIISGDRLYSLNLETGECAELPLREFPLQIQFTAENEMLAVVFGALMQMDRGTGDLVIISK